MHSARGHVASISSDSWLVSVGNEKVSSDYHQDRAGSRDFGVDAQKRRLSQSHLMDPVDERTVLLCTLELLVLKSCALETPLFSHQGSTEGFFRRNIDRQLL